MRIARFTAAGQTPRFGVLEGDPDGPDATITALAGFPLPPFELTDIRIPLAQVRLLQPVVPSKIVAFGKNYADHVAEMGGPAPDDPVLFLKPSTSAVGPDDEIKLPALTREVHHEAELAVVIGAVVRSVPVERALETVLGYTCANDVTARDLQRADGQWARAKGFDTFCPLGPWIETDLDPTDVLVECRVNGDLRQSASTQVLLHSVAELIAFASAAMTLLPGDVILTGTPAGVGPLVDRDVVEAEIEDIGVLRNPVLRR